MGAKDLEDNIKRYMLTLRLEEKLKLAEIGVTY